MKRQQIINLFTNPIKTMARGLWFSGIKGEGEYKEWHKNGQLWIHAFYKNDEKNGEYKAWLEDGKLYSHSFYKRGKLEGEYKEWHKNGQLWIHQLYKNGEVVKDYLA